LFCGFSGSSCDHPEPLERGIGAVKAIDRRTKKER
jgi:hypothetical protein